MKYIIVENPAGRETGVVFPDRFIHADIGRRYQVVVSAGFCERKDGGWETWGMSESLNLFSRPEDADILNRSTTANFKSGDRVVYIPVHADSDENHPDCERGEVTSTNTRFVFVKFDQYVKKLGWDGVTPKACDPSDLILSK